MNLNMFFNLRRICSQKTSVSSFYKENNFKLCLTKQLLTMFKPWCEQSISLGTRGCFFQTILYPRYFENGPLEPRYLSDGENAKA